MLKFLYLFLGGGIGTLTRYGISILASQLFSARFPIGTFVVNILGCFLAGLIAILIEQKFMVSPEVRILIFTGFFGGFTTFSAFMIETSGLVSDGKALMALGNVILSVVVGFVAFRFGVFVGELL